MAGEIEIVAQTGLGGIGLILMYRIVAYKLKHMNDTHDKIAVHMETVAIHLAKLSDNVKDLRSNTDRMTCKVLSENKNHPEAVQA